jgi:hypothetical protein
MACSPDCGAERGAPCCRAKKGIAMIAYRLGAAVALALALVVPMQAQTTLRGSDRPPGEASPANGSFSIRFPVPYKEISHAGESKDSALSVYILTGTDAEGVRFSATEIPVQQPAPPIESFLESSKRRRDAVASDVKHEQKDALEILSFTLSEPMQEYFFRIMRNETTGYLLVVQFQTELRAKAIGLKDNFFDSFRVIQH